ncbi:MAG TPA: SCO family protein, partial [Candidatus Baltobacteraceae bacterium]|nr:SCO family protein [Candidatus Baltobacteraceae bacterium]
MSLSCRARNLVAPLAAALLLWACGRTPAAPDFRLTDDTGHDWSLSAQRGTPVLLTFGFTHCADTCPATLAKLARLSAGASKTPVEIALVTVDPERDSVTAMHRFVARFGERNAKVVGLTGTPDQIDAVERSYHVWAQRIPGRHPHGAYDIAHSAVVYFIDPHGTTRSVHDDDDSDAVLSA